MPAKLGLDAKLYRNSGTYAAPTWDIVGNVKDLTLNLETGEADVSTRANNGWRATVGTLKDASLEFEMVWDTADSDFGAVRDAFLNIAANQPPPRASRPIRSCARSFRTANRTARVCRSSRPTQPTAW